MTTTPCPYADMFIMITGHVATMEECRKPVTVHAILIIKLLKVTNFVLLLFSRKMSTISAN
jgi:hypothetical protein